MLLRCSFLDAEMERVDLRGCRLNRCDFRYATMRRVTFANTLLEDCDFYRAVFDQLCVFEEATLEGVSLNRAHLGGIVDLRRASFDAGARPALVQEDGRRYLRFLKLTEKDRRDAVEAADANRHAEAALTYRRLVGLWESQGAYDDAAWAYPRARRLERAATSWRHRRRQWLKLWAFDALAGFGERLWVVALWALAVGLVPGVLYSVLGGLERERGGDSVRALDETLRFSLGQLVTSTPEGLRPNELVEWVGILQTLAGITLLGLVGFVLANNMRRG